MRELRLLLWLRWTLYLRANTTGNRIASIIVAVVMLAALSPLWIGGAIGAYAGLAKFGPRIVPVVFALTQIVWVWLGLVIGALGRTFDLDRLLRYPIRPLQIYAINVALTVIEPVGLMTLPTLGALTVSAYVHNGPVAALGVAVACVFVTLLTSAALQLLLALLDDLLRREWMRYLAAFAIPLTFMSIQVAIRYLGNDVLLRATHSEITADQALDLASKYLAWLPTSGLPALLAQGALAHEAPRALLGLIASAALLTLAVAPGTALMRRTAKAGESATGGLGSKGAGTRGSYAFAWLPFGHTLRLLLTREIRYTLGHPQRLLSMIVTPIVIILFYAVNDKHTVSHPVFFLVMMSSSVSAAAMTMFAYDGPGIRTLLLLPLHPREIVLSKNLEFLGKVMIELLVVIAAVTALNPTVATFGNLVVITAATSVILITAVIGTTVSIRWPVRARTRGVGQRQSGWGGLFSFLAVFGTGGLVALMLWATRRLVGDAFAPAATLLVASVLVAMAAALWWISLDRTAALFVSHREKLIEVLAKTDDV